MARPEIDIDKLSPEERLDLIEELWDSLSADAAKIPLTDAQARELDRRVAEMDEDNSLGIPWETVLAQIRRSSTWLVWLRSFRFLLPTSRLSPLGPLLVF